MLTDDEADIKLRQTAGRSHFITIFTTKHADKVCARA